MSSSASLNTPQKKRTKRHIALTPDERAVLQLAVQLRYLTVPLLVCFLDCSPDSAYRRLRRLCQLELLRSVRWQPGAKAGMPSIVAALTAKGAGVLAGDAPIPKAITILVRRSAARLRKVAAGEITTLAHDLAVLLLVGLFRRAFSQGGSPAAGTAVLGERYRLALTIPLDRIPVTVLSRLGLLMPGHGEHFSYLPDAVLPWNVGDRRGALFLEVETGMGGRLPADIGAHKATQFAALAARLTTAAPLERLGTLDSDATVFLLWCPNEHFRRRALDGIARVVTDPLQLVTLTGDDVPLALPPGIRKDALRPWMAETAERLRTTMHLTLPSVSSAPSPPAPHPVTPAATPPEGSGTEPRLGHFSLLSPR
jgi:hypothetical protein